jgi:hypothetical protein
MAIKLNIQKPEDWFNVSWNTMVKKEGGMFINAYYKGSIAQGSTIFDHSDFGSFASNLS